MKSRLLLCLVLCLTGWTTGAWAISTRTGGEIHCQSKKHDFYLKVPGGWRKVTQQQMDALRAYVDVKDEEFTMEWVAAYGRDYVMGNPTSLIAVAVGYYGDKRQISEGEIRRAVKLLTGADLETLRRASRGKGYDPSVTSVKTRSVEYYEDRKLLRWDTEVEIAGTARLEARYLCFFGRKVCVMIYGWGLAGQFANCGQGLDCAVRSFRFEPGAQYQEVEWYRSRLFAIALIAVATSLLAYTFRQRKH
jgi:hypothetical protein